MQVFVNYFRHSSVYKLYRLLENAYEGSSTRRILRVLSAWFNESVAVKAFKRFAAKRPTTELSFYQKITDKIGGLLLVITTKLHDFFTALLSGSIAYKSYVDFVESDGENRLRATAIFVFYFCLASVFTLSFAEIYGGRSANLLSGRMTALYVAALIFFVLAISGKRTFHRVRMACENSILIKLLCDLLK